MGRGKKLLGSGNFMENWEPLSMDKMNAQLTLLKGLFSDPPFGPFYATSLVLGKARARELAASRLCTLPPSEGNIPARLAPSVSKSSGKRTRSEIEDDESEMESDSDHWVKNKTARHG